MGSCNPRALFIISTATILLCEVCFVPVIILLPSPENEEQTNTTSNFCWSWKSGSSDAKCPFVVLLIASIVNGCLLLFIGFYLVFRCCVRLELLYARTFCKFTLKYGTFIGTVVTFVLSVVFICLIIGFTFSKEPYNELKYTGGLIKDGKDFHYRFVLICVGAFLSLLGTILNGLLCCHYSRPMSEEFTDGGMFGTFTDYSTASYEEIN